MGVDIIFLFLVIILAVGLPAFIKSLHYPRHISLKVLERDQIPVEHLRFLDEFDEEAQSMSFHFIGHFTLEELEVVNISRCYFDGHATLAIVSKVSSDEDESITSVYYEVISFLDEKHYISSQSSIGALLFYDPPGCTVLHYRNLRSLSVLYERHQKYLSQNKVSLDSQEDYLSSHSFEALEAVQNDNLQYQAEKGILVPDAEGTGLKAHWRAFPTVISRMFSPVMPTIDRWMWIRTAVCALGCAFSVLYPLVSFHNDTDFTRYCIISALFWALLLSYGILHRPFPWLITCITAVLLLVTSQQPHYEPPLTGMVVTFFAAGYFGYRLRILGDVEGGYETLLYPGLAVVVVLFTELVIGVS